MLPLDGGVIDRVYVLGTTGSIPVPGNGPARFIHFF
jgi:hypothetical protein